MEKTVVGMGNEKSEEAWKKEREIRDKNFDVCTDAEKILKLKWEIQELSHMAYSIASLNDKVDALNKHGHNEKGEITIPLMHMVANGSRLSGQSRRNNLA